jgi:uncharacterized protein YkwD
MRFSSVFLGLIALTLAVPASAQNRSRLDFRKPEAIAADLVAAHNKERALESLPALTAAPKLAEAARIHAVDMAEHEFMAHEGSDGSHPGERVARVGYHFLKAGENVARGYSSVPSVMKVWMESPPHRKNILDAEYTEIGVAVVKGKDGREYWAAEFGRPIPEFPPGEAERDLVERINRTREAARKPKLEVDARLAAAAEERARILARKPRDGERVPTGFDGIDDQNRFKDLALAAASGQPDAEAVLASFLESADHKANLMGKFTRVGVGYAQGEGGRPQWVLILGTPARR